MASTSHNRNDVDLPVAEDRDCALPPVEVTDKGSPHTENPTRLRRMVPLILGIVIGATGSTVVRETLTRPNDSDANVLTTDRFVSSDPSIEQKRQVISLWEEILSKLPDCSVYQQYFDKLVSEKILSNEIQPTLRGALNSDGELQLNWPKIDTAIRFFEATGVEPEVAVSLVAVISFPTLIHELSHARDMDLVSNIIGGNGFHRSIETEILARYEQSRVALSLKDIFLQIGITNESIEMVPFFGVEFQQAWSNFHLTPEMWEKKLASSYSNHPPVLTSSAEEYAACLGFAARSERTLIEALGDPVQAEEIRDIYRQRFNDVFGSQWTKAIESQFERALQRIDLSDASWPWTNLGYVAEASKILEKFPQGKIAQEQELLRNKTEGLLEQALAARINTAYFRPDHIRALELLCALHNQDKSVLLPFLNKAIKLNTETIVESPDNYRGESRVERARENINELEKLRSNITQSRKR